jgi:hypothetical protein
MESTPLLRPASAGELLDTAVGMAKRHYVAYLRLAWMPYLAAAALDYFSRLPAAPPGFPLVSLPAGLAVGAVVEVVLACASRDLLEGRGFAATPVGPILRKRWAAIVFGYLVKWVLVLVGFFLVILPGAYLLTLYFGVPYISAFEDVGLRAARRRSRDLARKHLARVFLTIGLFDLGAISLGLGVLLLVSQGQMTQAPAWARWISWLLGLTLAPLRGALSAAVYLDCRVRSEGYDLDYSLAILVTG